MTKEELISKIAEQVNLPKAGVNRCLKAFIEVVSDALQKGERLRLPDFGTFEVKERAQRKGRNPQTGEIITIPARKVVVFRTSKRLKDLVNNLAAK
jgi:DNA-binding protein HU-beta